MPYLASRAPVRNSEQNLGFIFVITLISESRQGVPPCSFRPVTAGNVSRDGLLTFAVSRHHALPGEPRASPEQ